MDANGKSDPYIKIDVDGHSQQQTSIAPKTLNPEWNETFIFTLDPDQVIFPRRLSLLTLCFFTWSLSSAKG
jgi:Ca2+-dependent lipid-binding protein